MLDTTATVPAQAGMGLWCVECWPGPGPGQQLEVFQAGCDC